MEFEFVDESVLLGNRGRPGIYTEPLAELMTALMSSPEAYGKWVKVPFEVPSQGTIQQWKAKYPKAEFTTRGGNHLKLGDPNKKLWLVYVRYTPTA